MASIVQHQHSSASKVAFAAHQNITTPGRPPRVRDLSRIEQIVTAVRKFGAISIKDLGIELHLAGATIRRHLPDLILAGRVEMLAETQWGASALYGPGDLDDQEEFDLYRRRTSSWPRGQYGRDPLVAALFGEVQTGGVA